ncbi:hypothetical protein [Streptomyces sp. WMMB 714]|uniref:hypothetical protein n=1 Tax=Streptomyces sp. WMMB 714 TaxID=1286822 RepID=UPI00094595BB|nr:hypothetical protein [Streptomyces sp. WMMB 714]
MKAFIGSHQVITDGDALELALGTPLELWLGVDGESEAERAARQDAARDILADDPELFDRAVRVVADALPPLRRPATATFIPLTPRCLCGAEEVAA